MEFIKELKQEHKKILAGFDKISAIGRKRSCLAEVSELEKILSVHMEKEDTIIYPAFNLSEHEELKKLGRMFSAQMKIYAKEITGCLRKIKKENGRPDTVLYREFEAISLKIQDRVIIEESILFPAYEKFFRL